VPWWMLPQNGDLSNLPASPLLGWLIYRNPTLWAIRRNGSLSGVTDHSTSRLARIYISYWDRGLPLLQDVHLSIYANPNGNAIRRI
jgi:hypothetical protein